MYLEERVEQLEALSVDQGRQIETIAKGLADLTVTVNNRFDRVDNRFDQVDNRFDRVEADVSVLKADVSILKEDVSELKSGQARLEVTVTDIQKTQQVILTLLQDKLK